MWNRARADQDGLSIYLQQFRKGVETAAAPTDRRPPAGGLRKNHARKRTRAYQEKEYILRLQQIFRVAVRACVFALLIAGAGLFPAQPAAGKETISAGLNGAAALDQLKRDGQYDSMQAAPLTIDPLFILQQKTLATDGAGDAEFGVSVALDGDTLVVGARLDSVGGNQQQGSAYVFTRSGGAWTLQQKLTASDGEENDLFGSSLALSGNTLVVGAPQDYGAFTNQGSVYIFTRSGAVWTQQQKLTAGYGWTYDFFGEAVAISGDTVVVGVRYDDIGADVNENKGSAYVFTRSGGVWTQQQQLTASDGANEDFFGNSVAVDGDTVVVGAHHDNIGSDVNRGSVYIFTRSGDFWTLQKKLLASNGGYFDMFGSSVAISGDTLVAGAENKINIDARHGTVYVFARSGAVWTEQQKLTAGDGGGTDHFGHSVGLSGDTLVVGALYDNIGSNTKQGSAYVFTRSGGVWAEQQKLVASDGAAQDYFGLAVAIDADTVVAGAPRDDIDANSDQGSVYVFFRPTTPPCSTIVLDPQVLPAGAMGVAYSDTLIATGASAPYTFVARTELPPGLDLSADGVVSGTPTEDGQFNFRILVTDANGCATSRDISIIIEKAEL
jgi:hypothetical protein